MTKTFSPLFSALAIGATRGVTITPAHGAVRGNDGLGRTDVSGAGLGSGRVNGVSGLDLGSSR